MKYYLFNPTGNITALIRDNTETAQIMKMEPECEQCGYIIDNVDGADISFRMAGGEFCGNATMCAGYLVGKPDTKVYIEGTGIVNVRCRGENCAVEMPKAREIVTYNGYPMVRFDGIDHVIIQDKLDPSCIKQWCLQEAIGFMYLKGNNMRPLVYVKGEDTLVWENSCASGTTAVGIYLNRDVEIQNPAGVLKYKDGYLEGKVKLIKNV